MMPAQWSLISGSAILHWYIWIIYIANTNRAITMPAGYDAAAVILKPSSAIIRYVNVTPVMNAAGTAVMREPHLYFPLWIRNEVATHSEIMARV